MDGKDDLMVHKGNFRKAFKMELPPEIIKMIEDGMRFLVPPRIRFRQEDGFHLVNIRWANTIEVDTDVAEFLIRYQNSGKTFDLRDFGDHGKEQLCRLYLKDAIISPEISHDDERHLAGLSLDPSSLPGQAA